MPADYSHVPAVLETGTQRGALMAETSAVAKEIARRLENVLTVKPGIAARIVDEELRAQQNKALEPLKEVK